MTTRHRKFAAADRRWDGGFTHAELTDFLTGEWVSCRSSNVSAARWVADALTLQFDDGSVYEYRPVDRDLAESFAHAPSKGGWRHDHFPKGTPGVTRMSG